jgi:hypothetical protein
MFSLKIQTFKELYFIEHAPKRVTIRILTWMIGERADEVGRTSRGLAPKR